MNVAFYVVTGLLAALLVLSAAVKLSGKPDVIESYARVGVDRRRLPMLAAVLLAGAAGLVIGLWWAPLGLAAAVALVVYFLLAVIAHARHDDLAHVIPPLALLTLAACSAALASLRL